MDQFGEMELREEKKDVRKYHKEELEKAKFLWTENLAYSHLIGEWYVHRCQHHLDLINECLEEIEKNEKER
jgi:hypothetical protein